MKISHRPFAALAAVALMTAAMVGAPNAAPLNRSGSAPAAATTVEQVKDKGQHKPGRFDLQGSWRLVALDRETLPDWARKTATINFESDSRLAGQAVCNNFSARYARRGSEIIIQDIVSTKKYCERGASLEEQILNALRRVDSVAAGENDTIILSTRGTPRLRYRRY
ncbi:META domain-containing protein [Acuticoccus sp. I52.16.1]|uniref:META domain-containing protein n=1 Tax=Acuticoccus sp. I52.16.1 TaxID=2928472 RepID=UPI001FD07980|nr:META domain-containing protein [Acuticoccus sp. I52.16.1]UOM33975.1 META domain-containing protein [Acuticoccus sp. I52.16.1]